MECPRIFLERYSIWLIKRQTQSYVILTSLIIRSIYDETNSYGVEFRDIPYKREGIYSVLLEFPIGGTLEVSLLPLGIPGVRLRLPHYRKGFVLCCLEFQLAMVFTPSTEPSE